MVNSVHTSASPYLNSIVKNNYLKNNISKKPLYNKNDFKKPENNKQTNSSLFSKTRKWLLSPVDVPNTTQTTRKTTRFEQLFTLLAPIIMFAALVFMSRSDKTKKTFLESTPVQDIWHDYVKAPKLSELALPDSLKRTTERLLFKIKNATEYLQKGGTNKKTILLYGPPGTGKTTYARAIAKEVPNSVFASIDLGAVEGKYAGESQANLNKVINEVCDYARNNPTKKVFVLFDEIDSIAMEDNGSANQQYRASILNALKKGISERLTALDNIVTIAATNVDIEKKENGSRFLQRLSQPIIDRFDEKIRVDSPTSSQLRQAIAFHYSNAPLASDYLKKSDSKEVQEIANALVQKNGSFRTLENVYNIAASESSSRILTFEDIMSAINKTVTVNGEKNIRNIGFA